MSCQFYVTSISAFGRAPLWLLLELLVQGKVPLCLPSWEKWTELLAESTPRFDMKIVYEICSKFLKFDFFFDLKNDKSNSFGPA
jgi:hypothetical protein